MDLLLEDNDSNDLNFPSYIAYLMIIPSTALYGIYILKAYKFRNCFPLKERSSGLTIMIALSIYASNIIYFLMSGINRNNGLNVPFTKCNLTCQNGPNETLMHVNRFFLVLYEFFNMQVTFCYTLRSIRIVIIFKRSFSNYLESRIIKFFSK